MSDPALAPLFGTDGIRGIVGELYTPQFTADIAAAFATFLTGSGQVLIGRDFRFTSPGIARILSGTLQMHGFDPIELGPMPTPCLQFNVRALGARAGLMVTASHNPVEFNGIKFCSETGLEFPPEAEREVERHFRARSFAPVLWNRTGTPRRDEMGLDRYLRSIIAHVDRPSIARAAARVVLDCGNGTSAVSSPPLFRTLGAKLVTLNANPDGAFPGRPSEPSDENLPDLKKTVVQTGASVGVAHDGDSDRIAFVDEKGQYVPGEVSLALFARYALAQQPGATIVTSVTSSSCIADVVASDGGRLVVTRSGSLPVAVGIEEEKAAFGGEENGHYYWPAHQNAPDGPMSSAVMLELLARSDRPLSALVAELPKYTVVKTKLATPQRLKEVVVEAARREFEASADHLVTIDGVKAFFPEGWILVRPSGTEPLVRVFAESRTAEDAHRLAERGLGVVRSVVEASQPNSTAAAGA
ncbi:MAG: phosphoglucosamine mutase [Thermoplasmata archaeon]|nr:phosphoglucosamine mutase [Thermoplasmata archaeon]